MILTLQLLVLECMLLPCELITLTSPEGIANGKWVLEEHSSGTLLCTISSYAGQMIWLFNSSKVAECTLTYCRQISTGDGTFMFGFDTINGVFEWTINAVDNAKHNGQVFVCFDGTNASNVTAIVKELASIRNDSDELGILQTKFIVAITIACIAIALVFVVLIILAIFTRQKWTREELAEVQIYFKEHLSSKTTPGRQECLRAIDESKANIGTLQRRSWETLKKVWNLIQKSK